MQREYQYNYNNYLRVENLNKDYRANLVEVNNRVVGVLENEEFIPIKADFRNSYVEDPATGLINIASPYGERSTRSTTLFKIIDFASKGYDEDLDLVRMGHRYMDSGAKRFITPDPLFMESPEKCVESPFECNLYSYAGGNPAMGIDPEGLRGCLFRKCDTAGGSLFLDFASHSDSNKYLYKHTEIGVGTIKNMGNVVENVDKGLFLRGLAKVGLGIWGQKVASNSLSEQRMADNAMVAMERYNPHSFGIDLLLSFDLFFSGLEDIGNSFDSRGDVGVFWGKFTVKNNVSEGVNLIFSILGFGRSIESNLSGILRGEKFYNSSNSGAYNFISQFNSFKDLINFQNTRGKSKKMKPDIADNSKIYPTKTSIQKIYK